METLRKKNTIWATSKLDDQVDILIGGTPSRKKKEYWDTEKNTDNVWVSIRDLSDLNGHIISDSSEYITDAGVQSSNVKLINKGIPLMSFKLSIGKTAIAGKDLYTNEAIAAFVPKNNDLDVGFLYHILPTLLYDTDTAVKGKTLNKEKLKKAVIVLPPINEQKKIAEILSSVDDDIRATQVVIDQTEQVKKGLMRDLFTKGIGHTKFKDSELGIIPESWEVVDFEKCIKKILDFRGRTPRKLGMEWGNGTIPALSANNVRMGSIDFSKECYFGSEALYKKWMVQGDLEQGDVLMTMEASLGNVAQVPDDQRYILSQRVVAFKADEKFVNDYLYYLLMSPAFQVQLEQRSTGTTAKGISQKNLLGIRVAVSVDQEEQQKISSALRLIDAKLKVYGAKREELKQIKQGLMQDLLSGEVRV